MNNYIRKGKSIIAVSMLILLISIGLRIYPSIVNNDVSLEFEYINTKDIAQAKNYNKGEEVSLLALLNNNATVDLSYDTLEEVIKPQKTVNPQPPRRIWYLPTEIGVVTQYPSYGHMAYDITSPRESYENIFPVANGVISGIYQDSAGALIVTIRHNVNGVMYTSQYVHLSRYAEGLYVGKPVTINDCIGKMGTTGISTGVHLHITVLDNCNLFGGGSNCGDLNSFYRYGRARFLNGYRGLGSVINVPATWNSR